MSQFDVYRNDGRNRSSIPFVLDIQSDLLSSALSTRIMVPLYKSSFIRKAALRLHVPLQVNDQKVIAVFDELSSVMLENTKKPIMNLGEHRNLFSSALDILFFNYP